MSASFTATFPTISMMRLALDTYTAGGATGGHMARCGRDARFRVSPWTRLRALAVFALCGVPFAGVHAVRPIRAQQEVLRASFPGGVALANETRGVDDAGEPAVHARGAFSCAEGDEPIELRWPEGWTRTTHEQRERALSPSFPRPDDADDDDDADASRARAEASHDDAASRRLFLKLAPLLLGEKRTLTVGAVGGSVTLGDVRRPDLAYPALFAAGLTEAFSLKKAGDGESAPPARDVSVVAANGAMGGTGSGYFALCVNRHLRIDADIVLVELNVNDGTDRSFERVHRKILDRTGRPAVLDVLAEIWKEKPADAADADDAGRAPRLLARSRARRAVARASRDPGALRRAVRVTGGGARARGFARLEGVPGGRGRLRAGGVSARRRRRAHSEPHVQQRRLTPHGRRPRDSRGASVTRGVPSRAPPRAMPRRA